MEVVINKNIQKKLDIIKKSEVSSNNKVDLISATAKTHRTYQNPN